MAAPLVDEDEDVDDEDDIGVIDSGGVGEQGDVEDTDIEPSLNKKLTKLKKKKLKKC